MMNLNAEHHHAAQQGRHRRGGISTAPWTGHWRGEATEKEGKTKQNAHSESLVISLKNKLCLAWIVFKKIFKIFFLEDLIKRGKKKNSIFIFLMEK